MSLRARWRRTVGSRSRRDPAVPPTPGGTGGSGFGAVGGAPPEPGARGSRAGGTTETPTAGGPRAPGTPEERRFSQVYAEDRVGPMPYPNQASPDVALARGRVRALVNDLLPGGVDEGTGGALDPLIASWASGWLARTDSEHADHHAVIDRLIGGARRQLADAEATHERDRRALEIARRDYADARDRLTETAPDPARPGSGSDAGAGSDAGTGRRGLLRRRGREARAADPSPEPTTGPVRIPPGSYGTTQPDRPLERGPGADRPLPGRTGPGVPLSERTGESR
ncbi:hypothetical protein [Actinomycetospora sp.]|uniref:hypothetical protein n=1 Tax=Actinomycetospora sp. TaxID=1872135 RepID=UPI002F420DB2